jgi:hypothetical protein
MSSRESLGEGGGGGGGNEDGEGEERLLLLLKLKLKLNLMLTVVWVLFFRYVCSSLLKKCVKVRWLKKIGGGGVWEWIWRYRSGVQRAVTKKWQGSGRVTFSSFRLVVGCKTRDYYC